MAIKVLPVEMVTEGDRLERFQREAESRAGLNHPDIVTIHSVEEDRGVDFLVMGLVPGKSLDRLLPKTGWHLPGSSRSPSRSPTPWLRRMP